MSQEDVEIVRRLFEFEPRAVLHDGGLAADHPFLSLWHPDCVLEVAATAYAEREPALAAVGL